jgi:hypothetical protein
MQLSSVYILWLNWPHFCYDVLFWKKKEKNNTGPIGRVVCGVGLDLLVAEIVGSNPA